jgi:hypothetical protein
METLIKGLAIVTLVFVLFTGYIIKTNIDYSSNNISALFQLLLLGTSFACFYKLFPQRQLIGFSTGRLKLKGDNLAGFVSLIYIIPAVSIIVIIDIGSKEIHEHLLERRSQATVATVKECHDHGNYCVYIYRVNGRTYEHLFHNYAFQLKDADTITIHYYVPNPLISRIDGRYKRR